MKIFILIALSISLSSCYSFVRIGDLTMVSNRNIEKSKKYILIQRNAQGMSNNEHDALENAIDKTVEHYSGDYLMNVKIYVSNNGKIVKVEGDVYGLQETKDNAKEIKSGFRIGELVSFRHNNKWKDGTIVGDIQNHAIVEYKTSLATKKATVLYEYLVKKEMNTQNYTITNSNTGINTQKNTTNSNTGINTQKNTTNSNTGINTQKNTTNSNTGINTQTNAVSKTIITTQDDIDLMNKYPIGQKVVFRRNNAWKKGVVIGNKDAKTALVEYKVAGVKTIAEIAYNRLNISN